MNVDAVNQKESVINSYLSRALQFQMKNALDPFMRVILILFSDEFFLFIQEISNLFVILFSFDR